MRLSFSSFHIKRNVRAPEVARNRTKHKSIPSAFFPAPLTPSFFPLPSPSPRIRERQFTGDRSETMVPEAGRGPFLLPTLHPVLFLPPFLFPPLSVRSLAKQASIEIRRLSRFVWFGYFRPSYLGLLPSTPSARHQRPTVAAGPCPHPNPTLITSSPGTTLLSHFSPKFP